MAPPVVLGAQMGRSCGAEPTTSDLCCLHQEAAIEEPFVQFAEEASHGSKERASQAVDEAVQDITRVQDAVQAVSDYAQKTVLEAWAAAGQTGPPSAPGSLVRWVTQGALSKAAPCLPWQMPSAAIRLTSQLLSVLAASC